MQNTEQSGATRLRLLGDVLVSLHLHERRGRRYMLVLAVGFGGGHHPAIAPAAHGWLLRLGRRRRRRRGGGWLGARCCRLLRAGG